MLQNGIYEQVVSEDIGRELDTLPPERRATGKIDQGEASRVLSQYVAGVVEKGLDMLHDSGEDLNRQVQLANRIVELIRAETQENSFSGLQVDPRAEQLLALLSEQDGLIAANKTAKDLPRPETSISRSSLFTGAVHEPQMFSELKKEIRSADHIDFLVSFIRWSGLRLILEELRDFTDNGGHLRVITTTYMGATDFKSVDWLASRPNTEVRISYDTKRTRLHAKAYVFLRENGFSTAYVGSSNLTNPAISSGLEWNLKVTAQDQPETLQKINATFDSYWNDREFELYGPDQRERLMAALNAERKSGIPDADPSLVFNMEPYPYQQEILDRIQVERQVRGRMRNLVVAATGTGKTAIAAFDYRNFCRAHPGERNRLLFVAHREEILRQSLSTFRIVMKDLNFGDLLVGTARPERMDHLFVSVQSLNSQALWTRLPADYYDYIIVDEFHHAAAPTYQKLLSYFTPQILLGLTATPERMDGKSILDYFGGHIAAEIRLPEAIERRLLCPFQYFGVTDDVDLSQLKWSRGGYDRQELSNLFSFTKGVAEKRAAHIIRSVNHYVTDMDDVRGLGFCVSVDHARFMAEQFNKAGIPSMALLGTSDEEERLTAKQRLVRGEVKFLFVVDIYNEGVDIPEVNTVLFLRPTESLTIFLQQLGRGLRLANGKECLTVLDFIGQAHKKYSFEEKFAALLSNSGRSVATEVRLRGSAGEGGRRLYPGQYPEGASHQSRAHFPDPDL